MDGTFLYILLALCLSGVLAVSPMIESMNADIMTDIANLRRKIRHHQTVLASMEGKGGNSKLPAAEIGMREFFPRSGDMLTSGAQSTEPSKKDLSVPDVPIPLKNAVHKPSKAIDSTTNSKKGGSTANAADTPGTSQSGVTSAGEAARKSETVTTMAKMKKDSQKKKKSSKTTKTAAKTPSKTKSAHVVVTKEVISPSDKKIAESKSTTPKKTKTSSGTEAASPTNDIKQAESKPASKTPTASKPPKGSRKRRRRKSRRRSKNRKSKTRSDKPSSNTVSDTTSKSSTGSTTDGQTTVKTSQQTSIKSSTKSSPDTTTTKVVRKTTKHGSTKTPGSVTKDTKHSTTHQFIIMSPNTDIKQRLTTPRRRVGSGTVLPGQTSETSARNVHIQKQSKTTVPGSGMDVVFIRPPQDPRVTRTDVVREGPGHVTTTDVLREGPGHVTRTDVLREGPGHVTMTDVLREGPGRMASILAHLYPRLTGMIRRGPPGHFIGRGHFRGPRIERIVSRGHPIFDPIMAAMLGRGPMPGRFVIRTSSARTRKPSTKPKRKSRTNAAAQTLHPMHMFMQRELCSETPSKLRSRCSDSEPCHHQMNCARGVCCARSFSHAERLDNVLDQMESRRPW